MGLAGSPALGVRQCVGKEHVVKRMNRTYGSSGLKIKQLCCGPHDMFHNLEFKNVLKGWSAEGRLCNMHTERALAALRHEVQGKAPFIETVMSAGYVGQARQAHTQHGGHDPRVLTAPPCR